MKNQSQYQYFATLPIDELLPALNGKIDNYYKHCEAHGVMKRWRDLYRSYYGMSESGAKSSELNRAGAEGEKYILRVNQLRSLLLRLITMTTSSRPAWAPKSSNTDSRSLDQAILARTILDYYMFQKHLDQEFKKVTEIALLAGESFLALTWNSTSGDVIAVSDSGAKIHQGDAAFRSFHPLDVCRDTDAPSDAESQWKITREYKNKWDLVVQFPEFQDEILGFRESDNTPSFSRSENQNSDLIPVWTFYHGVTPSIPSGRRVEFIETQILTDDALPYREIPVYRLAPNELQGSIFGWTVGYDLLSPQKNYDALQSIIATNQLNLGVATISVPRGSNISATSLAEGLNVIEHDQNQGAPTVLDLVRTSPEIFTQSNTIIQQMQSLSGVNETARGNTSHELSGAALALLSAQAIEQNSGLQSSYNSILENVGTGLINLLQMYAMTDRMITIAGKSNRNRIKAFTSKDLEGIQRVVCESVNPVSKTSAGRLSMAQDMLKTNLITTAQAYLEVVETGSIETLLESDTSEIILIRSENEDIADGKKPNAISIDIHSIHIKEHKAVLSSPEARADPNVVKACLAHIQEHIDLQRSTDPALLAILGEQPLPPKQTPGAQAPTAPNGNAIPQMLNPTPPAVQTTQGIKQPKAPGLPHLPASTPPELQAAYQQVKAPQT
jgi:hypothetical protein